MVCVLGASSLYHTVYTTGVMVQSELHTANGATAEHTHSMSLQCITMFYNIWISTLPGSYVVYTLNLIHNQTESGLC
jgi:hypothetical protein